MQYFFTGVLYMFQGHSPINKIFKKNFLIFFLVFYLAISSFYLVKNNQIFCLKKSLKKIFGQNFRIKPLCHKFNLT